jgi:hypothetical protein
VFGNPLLDISVTIKDDELLVKYALEKNGQKEVSLEKLGKLIGDAKARYGLNFTFRMIHRPNKCDPPSR